MNKKRTTKGKHKRRRFIDAVNEGVAQLANYEEYFNFEKNRDYAYTKFGVKIKNPTIYLIVGNYANIIEDEINEAKRMLKENYKIIDYDTLRNMYLLK